MKRTLLLSALLIPLLARASGVAALGDIACGIYTNTATNGIIGVTNEWYEFPWSQNPWPMQDSWWPKFGLAVPNATAVDDAALTKGQLKWAARCAAEALEEAAWMAGGAGSEIWSMVSCFSMTGNDDAVNASEFFSVVDPIARRVWELSVDGMFYGLQQHCPSMAQSNDLVSVRELKIAMTFDPFYDQFVGGTSCGNGLRDWWERYYFSGGWNGGSVLVLPDDDPDCDGLTNLLEFERGSDPLDRDTDGDGLVDGIDPDPHWWTWSGDEDHDGVPDALETDWFGGTDVVGSASDLDWAGFRFDMALAAGICPTNPLPGTTYPTNGVASLPLVPRFGLEAVSGETVWEVSFDLPRHGAWEQYFLAVTPDPYSDPGSCPSPFSGLSLEWTAPGASGTLAFPAPGYVVPIPVPPRAPNDSSFEITLRLVAT